MKFIYSKSFAIFAGALVFVVIMLFLQNRGYLDSIRGYLVLAPRPIVQVGRSIALPVKTFFGTLYGMRGILKENTDLKKDRKSVV